MRQSWKENFVAFLAGVAGWVIIMLLAGCSGGGGGGGTVGQVSAVSTPEPTPTQTTPTPPSPPPAAYVPKKGIVGVVNGNIWRFGLDAQGRILSSTQLTSGGRDSCPTASTWVDETTQVLITFQRDMGGGNQDIFVMNVDGSGLTNVSNSPAVDKQPIFYDPIVGQPQGIWFCSNREGDFEIYQVDLNGGALTRQSVIVSAAPASRLSASRAWTYFVFMSQKEDGVQKIFSGLNQGMTRLTEGEDNYPDVSPDSAWVAYTHTDPNMGRWEIWAIGGSGKTKFSGLPAGENWYPKISPDGSEFLFVNSSSKSISTAAHTVYRVWLDGTGLTKIQDGVLYPDWIWYN